MSLSKIKIRENITFMTLIFATVLLSILDSLLVFLACLFDRFDGPWQSKMSQQPRFHVLKALRNQMRLS